MISPRHASQIWLRDQIWHTHAKGTRDSKTTHKINAQESLGVCSFRMILTQVRSLEEGEYSFSDIIFLMENLSKFICS